MLSCKHICFIDVFCNNLYQEGSVLDSDVFDMWGDKGTYSKAFSIHFGYYNLMGC